MDRFILDGEIVVPVDGRLSFDDLLQRLHPAALRVKKLAAEIPAQYFVFDLLARDGMVKVKHFKTADCVVGGFRYATGSSSAIGSLLLGLHDDEGHLVFIGHTSSFTKDERFELQTIVEPLQGENPFSVRVRGGPSRWSSERSGEWVALRPELVCEVEYDYFSQGRPRHGSKFLRWRPEKKPAACTMDQVDPSRLEGTLDKLGMS